MSLVPAALERVHAGELTLSSFTGADVGALTEAFADPDIARWNPGPGDDDTVTEWMARRNDWAAGTHASWSVRDRDDQLVGSVSLHRIDTEQLDAEIGYWVAPVARGQAVAARAVAAATRYAFTGLGLHRVYLFHAVDNTASCRVAERAGFRLEGHLLQSFRYTDGYHDEHLHAILATELPI